MPVIFELKRALMRETLESDLRQDWHNIRITRGLTGSVRARVRFDIAVVFEINSARVRIYATHPVLYALFFAGGRFGYAEDEKRHFEREFSQWFSDRYEEYIQRDEH